MKTKQYFFIPILLVIMITALFAGTYVKPAYAQEPVCTDAAGGVIPCPPPADIPCGQAGGPACPPPPSDDNNSGNQNPPSTPATATSTPLPISAAPTSTPLPDENYLGSCTNADDNVFDCFEKFKCEDGLLVIEVDLYADGGTKYDFYCIPDENVPQLNLPLTIPDPVGKDGNWTGGCAAGDGLDACLDLASDHCSQEGGEISIWYDDDGAGVYCENQSEASQPAPEASPLPLAVAPQTGDTSGEDWDESCSWASCFAYDIMCWADGGSGYGQEDGAGNTVYHCDMPEGSTSGNNLKQLGLATIVVVVLIGLLLPAVQKIREAATRTRMESNRHKLMETLTDGDEGGTEAGHMRLEDIKGESNNDSASKPKPKPTPPPS